MLGLELPDRRPGGGPKRRFMDGVRRGMKLAGAREGDAEDRVRRRQMIGHPKKGTAQLQKKWKQELKYKQILA